MALEYSSEGWASELFHCCQSEILLEVEDTCHVKWLGRRTQPPLLDLQGGRVATSLSSKGREGCCLSREHHGSCVCAPVRGYTCIGQRKTSPLLGRHSTLLWEVLLAYHSSSGPALLVSEFQGRPLPPAQTSTLKWASCPIFYMHMSSEGQAQVLCLEGRHFTNSLQIFNHGNLRKRGDLAEMWLAQIKWC